MLADCNKFKCSKDMKRFACHRLYLSSTNYIDKAVVEVDEQGYYTNGFPLTAEIDHTVWLGGIIVLSPLTQLPAADWAGMTLADCLQLFCRPALKLIAWHIDTIDWKSMQLNPTTTIRRI